MMTPGVQEAKPQWARTDPVTAWVKFFDVLLAKQVTSIKSRVSVTEHSTRRLSLCTLILRQSTTLINSLYIHLKELLNP